MRILPLFLIIVIFITGCKGTGPKSLSQKYQDYSVEELFGEGEQALVKKRYRTAIEYFEAMDALYPFGEYSEQSRLNLIYAYYKRGEHLSAVAAAERFIQLYPRSSHVDYAFYMKGVANIEMNRTLTQRFLPINISERDIENADEAFEDFNILIRRFPDSPYAPEARQRMIYLRNLLAEYELSVAKFYMRRGAYVAAVNRINYLVGNYQSAPEVAEGLHLLMTAYIKLDLTESANETFQLLRLNFPESPWYRQAEQDIRKL